MSIRVHITYNIPSSITDADRSAIVLFVLCYRLVAHSPRQLCFALRSVAVAVQQTIPHIPHSRPVVCRCQSNHRFNVESLQS